jgi:hypothetical protein
LDLKGLIFALLNVVWSIFSAILKAFKRNGFFNFD